jgi:hypothetical protein
MSIKMVTFCQATKKVSQCILLCCGLMFVGCKKESPLESQASIIDFSLPKTENEKTINSDEESAIRKPTFVTAKKDTAKIDTAKNDTAKSVQKQPTNLRQSTPSILQNQIAVTTTSGSISTRPTETKKSSVADLTTIVELGLSSNLKTDASAEADRSTSIGLTLNKGISKNTSMSVIAGVEQSFVAEKKTAVNNTVVQINRNGIPLTNSLKLKTGISATLPTNQDDREKATLRGGTGASLSLEQKTSLFKKPATLNYGLGVLKNYHEYTRNSDLGSNLSHRIRYSATANIEATKNTSLSMSGYYQTGWTYDSALRTTFSIRETLSYMLNKNTEVSISHVNSANALEANGVDSNVSLYDENNSYVELGLSATY